MEQSLVLSPTRDAGRFKTADGRVVVPPEGWECLPPGDAGLTRRVKALGPTWTVIEQKGRKKFSHGIWAPAANIATARTQVETERASPAYARRRQSDAKRREVAQTNYVQEFRDEVLAFLAFAPCWRELAENVAEAVTAHATPVGSGTVARTKRIEVDERAEAAVIAWMRHQTTAYDDMSIARLKGERRRVRRELAERSRQVLQRHRDESGHDERGCPLCQAVKAS